MGIETHQLIQRGLWGLKPMSPLHTEDAGEFRHSESFGESSCMYSTGLCLYRTARVVVFDLISTRHGLERGRAESQQ